MRPSVSCGSVCRCTCETYARLDSRDKTMVAFCKPSICRHFTICFKTSLCVSRTSVCSKPAVCWVSEYDLTHAMRAHRAPFVFSASKPTTYRKPPADVRHAQWGCRNKGTPDGCGLTTPLRRRHVTTNEVVLVNSH